MTVKNRPMHRRSRLVAVSAILLATFASAPVPADSFGGPRGLNRAGGFQGCNPGGFQGFNPGGSQGFNPGQAGRPFQPGFSKHGRFFPHDRFHRSFAWGGGYVIGGYGAPFYYGSLDYGPTTPVYNPSALHTPPVYVSVVAPGSGSGLAAPAHPAVIEYPGGRYELRGDGVTVPYNWVWIPNPPSGPPAPAPPPTASGPSDQSSARRSKLYRWVDEQGVLHMTNNADVVPQQFRKQTKPRSSL